jgi:hypothetical protein
MPYFLALPVTEKRRSLASKIASQLKGRKRLSETKSGRILFQYEYTAEIRSLLREFAEEEVCDRELVLPLC